MGGSLPNNSTVIPIRSSGRFLVRTHIKIGKKSRRKGLTMCKANIKDFWNIERSSRCTKWSRKSLPTRRRSENRWPKEAAEAAADHQEYGRASLPWSWLSAAAWAFDVARAYWVKLTKRVIAPRAHLWRQSWTSYFFADLRQIVYSSCPQDHLSRPLPGDAGEADENHEKDKAHVTHCGIV